MLKLLGKSGSINVRKVCWTLEELGLDYEHEVWGEGDLSLNAPEFRALNPVGLVPVLIDGDQVLTQSNSICRYLARRQQRMDLFGGNLAGQAYVDAWMDWQLGDLNPTWVAAFLGLIRNHPAYANPEDQRKSIEKWTARMVELEAHLSTRAAYVCGDDFTLADIVLALSVNRWEMVPFDKPDLPATKDWMSRLSGRTGFALYCRNGMP